MQPLPNQCPFCEGEVVVQRVRCRQCDTTIEGQFSTHAVSEFDEAQLPVLRRFARLAPEQLQFLETFVRCEGRFNQMKEEIGSSYPTLRARLDEVLRELGFAPLPEEEQPSGDGDRRQVLDDLAAGRISADEATRRLRQLAR